MIPTLLIFWLSFSLLKRHQNDVAAAGAKAQPAAGAATSVDSPPVATFRGLTTIDGRLIVRAPNRAQGPILRAAGGGIPSDDAGRFTAPNPGQVSADPAGFVCYPEMCLPTWGSGRDWFARYRKEEMRARCCKKGAVET